MIQSELIMLLASFGFGAGIVLSYGFVELLRLFLSVKKPLRVLSELVYWTAAAILAFWLQMKLNNGILRLYSVLEATAGLVLFRRITESVFDFLMRKASKLAAKRRKKLLMVLNRLKNYQKQVRMRLSSFRALRKEAQEQKAGRKES